MIRKLFSSQLRLNMISGTMAIIINVVVMAIAYPMYLHFLGYETYGVWLVLGTVLTLAFAQFGNLGINQAVIKLVAEEYGRNNIKGVQSYIVTAIALLCLSGTVVLVVILALKSQIIAAFKLSDENARIVSWLLPYVCTLSIYVFIVHAFESTLSGLGRMDLSNYIQSISRIVALGVTAGLLYSGRGIESLIIGNALSYVFIHIVTFICIRWIAPLRIFRIGNLDSQYGRRLLSFGSGVFGSSAIRMLASPFNKLMLSRYAGVASLPVYEVAFTGSMQVRGLIEAGLRALMPEISRLSGDMEGLARQRISQIYRRSMRLIFLFGTSIYAVLMILAPILLKVWLGERFVETLPATFRIMLIGSFLSLIGAPAYYLLMGVGRIRNVFFGTCITSVLSSVLVAFIGFTTTRLSPLIVGLCFVPAHTLSTIYKIWTSRSNRAKNLYNESNVIQAKAPA